VIFTAISPLIIDETVFEHVFLRYDAPFTITPEATTPLPAALPLFATGAGLLAFIGWRRKKKAAALAT
jgi:hypothetical protein